MKLTINNQVMETTVYTLSALATELALPEAGVAIAVDKRLIPQTGWETFYLEEDMKIIIIKAACGG